MSGTFKWLTLKAGTALSRNVSSLFYQLYYREIYREIHQITKNGPETVQDCYKLGYLSANESAARQRAVFRFFPSDPEKVLEYVPLLWELYFGQPMQEFETEWDRSDPDHPILKYKIQVDPMTFEVGKDTLRDNLPWDAISTPENKYGALMAGLLTQCTSYVLKIREKTQRIVLKNTKNQLQGDPYFEFHCQVIDQEDFPNFGFDDSPVISHKDETTSISGTDKILAQISEHIDLESLDQIIDDPIGGIRLLLSKSIEKGAKMSTEELLDHFTNDEEKFLQIIGFLFVHLTNEWGQIPQKIFTKDSIAKIFGHQFKFIYENRTRLFPLSVISDFKGFLVKLFTTIAPEIFVNNLTKISPENIFDLMFKGAKRALVDLGIPFSTLKPSMYEELQAMNQKDNEQTDISQYTNRLYARLFDQFMMLSSVIISLPTQISVILLSKLVAGSNEVLQSLFLTLRESIQEIVDIIDELEDHRMTSK